IQLYEDQILRGRDPALRAELARKVARIWEEQLADGREAADAWRRVLRMKAGDTEAMQGLDRTKANQLKKPEGDPRFVYAPPKLVSDQPVPPPTRGTKSLPPGASSSHVSDGAVGALTTVRSTENSIVGRPLSVSPPRGRLKTSSQESHADSGAMTLRGLGRG